MGTPVVNVDGDVGGGVAVSALYATVSGTAPDERDIISFERSFIGEQVNASIQALPNDVVRHSYVHTVFNYGKDQDQVFIYPSMGVPLFKSKLAAKTLAAGEVTGDVIYPTGSGVCSPDSSFLTATSAECGNIGNFNDGKS